MKTTCYVCGKEVARCYYEVLHKETSCTDRVFLCCYDCIDKVEDKYYDKREVVKDE